MPFVLDVGVGVGVGAGVGVGVGVGTGVGVGVGLCVGVTLGVLEVPEADCADAVVAGAEPPQPDVNAITSARAVTNRKVTKGEFERCIDPPEQAGGYGCIYSACMRLPT
ncbi:MAG: hypothetical protein JOZ44_05885 [Acidobacteria bacterium]|nr:hypothetical protein [Acidobacteriota bacterium]